MEHVEIRTILPEDNGDLAAIVRAVLAEFGANRPGTVYFDPTTDNLYQLFQQEGSIYYVAHTDQEIIGGAGIYPSAGLPDKTCELVKMYLTKKGRGQGLGKMLIEKCIDFATSTGYKHIYIETMPELKKAMSIYEKFGFYYLKAQMGCTGHYGCDVWMMKDIDSK
jgi:putative acetyltransferase